ncbi:MAG: hypothetical protein RIR39_1677 [Pseudomonadota bacterium]|jgi:hypothetical protein
MKVGVMCEYWNKPVFIDVEICDGDNIEHEIRDAAIEAAKFEYWVEDEI